MVVIHRCAECGELPSLTNGVTIYPHRQDLHELKFYLCKCGAYVGVHRNTDNALGSPAATHLRSRRIALHNIFDPLWQRKMKQGFSKRIARNRAYAWLAKEMNLTKDQCHISLFDLDKCEIAMKVLIKFK